MTLRGAATGTGTHEHPLTHPRAGLGPPGWAGDVGTLLKVALWRGAGARRVTVAMPAGAKSRPGAPLGRLRQRERVRIRPVWLRRPPYRLIALSPLSRAAPGAAPPGVLRSPCRRPGRRVPPASPHCQAGSPSPASEPGHAVAGWDFLGKVPAGGTRLQRGRPRCWWVPLTWFCRPAPRTPGDVAVGVPPACGGEVDPAHPSWGIRTSGREFRVGGPFPKVLAGGGAACASSDLPRPLVRLLGLVCFGVSGGKWVRSDVPPPQGPLWRQWGTRQHVHGPPSQG